MYFSWCRLSAQSRALLVLVICCFFSPSLAFIDGLYCGVDNCYDVLGVARDASRRQIATAYRQLARKTHPDRFQAQQEKESASEKFRQIANAYEILKDDGSRTDYDYMLDNPDEFYAHYYRYYRRRMAPRVDIRIVLAVSITIISVIQYYSYHSRYQSAIRYLVSVPKYRLQAQQIAKSERLLDNIRKSKKMSKEEIRNEEDRIFSRIIEEKMDIRGGYSRPTVYDLLWVQLLFLPYTLCRYLVWLARWLLLFTLLRRQYGRHEKLFLIRRNLAISQAQFDSLEESTVDEYLELQLWKRECFKAWRAEQEEENRRRLATSGQHKQYRRYMKQHGPGRIYFDD